MVSDPDHEAQIEIRLAASDEVSVVSRLAALDSAPALRSPVLLALVHGEPVAARSLVDGRVVADPFRPTDGVLRVLALAAEQMQRTPDEPLSSAALPPNPCEA